MKSQNKFQSFFSFQRKLLVFVALTAFLAFSVDVLKISYSLFGIESFINKILGKLSIDSSFSPYVVFILWFFTLYFLIIYSLKMIKEVKIKDYKPLSSKEISNNEILILGISDNNNEIESYWDYEEGVLIQKNSNNGLRELEKSWYKLYEEVNQLINDFNNNKINFYSGIKNNNNYLKVDLQHCLDKQVEDIFKNFAKKINLTLPSYFSVNNIFTLNSKALDNKCSLNEILEKHLLILKNSNNYNNYINYFENIILKDINEIISLLQYELLPDNSLIKIKKPEGISIKLSKDLNFEDSLGKLGINFKLRFPLCLTHNFLSNNRNINKKIIIFHSDKSIRNVELYRKIVHSIYGEDIKIEAIALEDIVSPIKLLSEIKDGLKKGLEDKQDPNKVLVDITGLTKTYSLVLSSLAESYDFKRIYVEADKNSKNMGLIYHYWKNDVFKLFKPPLE